MAFCKGCGANIDWHKTADGKNVPVDPEPVPNGNLHFEAGLVVYGKATDGRKLYVSHFATCPKAADFRKKKS